MGGALHGFERAACAGGGICNRRSFRDPVNFCRALPRRRRCFGIGIGVFRYVALAWSLHGEALHTEVCLCDCRVLFLALQCPLTPSGLDSDGNRLRRFRFRPLQSLRARCERQTRLFLPLAAFGFQAFLLPLVGLPPFLGPQPLLVLVLVLLPLAAFEFAPLFGVSRRLPLARLALRASGFQPVRFFLFAAFFCFDALLLPPLALLLHPGGLQGPLDGADQRL
jgi:hypothetical protein